MRFSNYFKIWLTRKKLISLEDAIKLAPKFDIYPEMLYDPLGKFNAESWHWCVAMLEVLQQEDIIREFEVVKPAPSDQQIESKSGVIY